jgi:anion-transporting  ArsA/GET3 family ATPase
MAEPRGLLELARSQNVLVCVGSGGVGKTTVSAAIALRAAQLGRTACVVTIDPARRLANALGLNELGNRPTRVDEARFDEAGLPRPSGRLFAMMLDTKRTWDDLVHRFAPSEEQARRILANRYYQNISGALAGSQEFMAMEKLYELHESGAYELLVLDTPPTQHALDFLDSPKRMIEFMDDRLLRFLMMPTQMGKFGLGMLTSSTAMRFGVLQRITGFNVLNDIGEYVASFSGMHEGFKERAKRVEEHLRSTRTSFALVANPSPQTIDEAVFFFRKLLNASMPFGGFIVNRVQTSGLGAADDASQWEHVRNHPSALTADADLSRRLIENFASFETMAAAHAAQIASLAERCPGAYFRRVIPAFDEDVRDLGGLARVNAHLFEADPR